MVGNPVNYTTLYGWLVCLYDALRLVCFCWKWERGTLKGHLLVSAQSSAKSTCWFCLCVHAPCMCWFCVCFFCQVSLVSYHKTVQFFLNTGFCYIPCYAQFLTYPSKVCYCLNLLSHNFLLTIISFAHSQSTSDALKVTFVQHVFLLLL